MIDQKNTGESTSLNQNEPPDQRSSVVKRVISFFSRQPESEEEKRLAKHEAKKEADQKLVMAVSQKGKTKWPSWQQLHQLKHFLSASENWAIKASSIVIAVAVVFLFINFWFFTLQLAPDYGGEYSEGLVGNPKYINPVLAAANDVDLDISSLIFSGLMKYGAGGLQTDLAEKYEVSEDQKEYTFILKRGVKWHGSEREVTADDVLLTFDLIKDPDVASPLAVSFKGITAEKVDDYTLKFFLKEPFTPFLSTLTFGILPEHLWSNIDPANIKLAELNLKPIGFGPFQFDSLKKDKQGSLKSFTVVANKEYYLGRPYLDKVVFKFYPDLISLEQALLNKNVMAPGYLSRESRDKIFGTAETAKGLRLHSLNLPQYSAVFFNQNNSEILKEKNIRQALYQAIDRQLITRQVLASNAEVIHGPILRGFIGYYSDILKYDYSPTEATALLDSGKWQAINPNEYISWQREQEKENLAEGEEFVDRSSEERLAEIVDQEYFRKKGAKILEITLTVVDQSEHLAVAEIIKENWQAVGVRTNLNIVSPDDVLREVIKPRNYQALLYSEIVGYDPDPYPFWHSSQNSGSGLNLSVFTDKRVDKYIEAARQTNDPAEREENYKKFQDILAAEVPAIFLYSPIYSYVVSDKVKGLSVEKIFAPADRLSDMKDRYIETRRAFKASD